MKKTIIGKVWIIILIVIVFFGILWIANHYKSKDVSFTKSNIRFTDSLFVDSLMDFMLSENLLKLPKDISKQDYFQGYIGHDYLTDSTGTFFYIELESGSCGNTVYVLNKKSSDFEILSSEDCIEVNTELEHNDTVAGVRVIYVEKPKSASLYKIAYDGKEFTFSKK